MVVAALGLVGCRIENPGFGVGSNADEPLRENVRLPSGQQVSPSGETHQQQELEPEAEPGSTASTTASDDGSTTNLTSTSEGMTGTESSSGETGTSKELALCDQGEDYCYLMKKNEAGSSFASHRSAGPSLVLAEPGMTLVVGPSGKAGPFETYVQFGTSSVLETQSLVLAAGVSGDEFFGFDLIVRDPRCTQGGTRCGFARMANLVLSVDTEKEQLICSFLGSDGLTEVGAVSGPWIEGGVNRIGCGALGRQVSLFANGTSNTQTQPASSQQWVQSKITFGSHATFPGNGTFVGDVGVMRYWTRPSKMEAALVDG